MSSSECPNQNVLIKMSSSKCPHQNVPIKMSSSKCPHQNVLIKMSQSKCPNRIVLIRMSLNGISNKPESGHPTLQSKTFRRPEPVAGCPRVKLTSEEGNKKKLICRLGWVRRGWFRLD
jgi:hypothetical protein